jgi:peptidoglycan/LPS O-acetylase OafA/YrhL
MRPLTNVRIAAETKANNLGTLLKQRKDQPQKRERLYLAFLDGLRGSAALYVMLFHVVADGVDRLAANPLLLDLLRFGHEAVVIFIVLSGFLLSLPVARSPKLALSGGLRGFFKRRARRILPAYYAALFVWPLYLLLVELLRHIAGENANWTRIGEMFLNADMLSHLFLLHNLSNVWAGSINPVLWSLSTEWWIYFVFALVLLPVWRRFGVFSAICTSIILGLAPTIIFLLGWPSIAGSPHLLGAFGLGMGSAALLCADGYLSQTARWGRIMGLVAIVSFVAFCSIAVAAPSIRLNTDTQWITDLLIGVVCAIVIALAASAALVKRPSPSLATIAIRILQSRPLVSVGRFSYSLYLTHLVVWNILGTTLNLAPVRQLVRFSLDPMAIRVLVLIPLLLISAYGFYLLFEKPFLRYHGRAQ